MVCAVVGLVAYVFHRSSTDAREMSRIVIGDMRDVTKTAVMALGHMNPHVVDPETFGPSGMARVDEEKQAATEKVALSAQEQLLREAEEKYFDQLRRVEASRDDPGALET